jgi:hypothetical protein
VGALSRPGRAPEASRRATRAAARPGDSAELPFGTEAAG